MSAYFTPNATLVFSARSFHGREQISQVYAQRAARGPRVARHLMTNVHVTDATDTTAVVVSSLCLFAEDGEPPRPTAVPAMVGDVVDYFEQHDGCWLISSRHVHQIFVSADTVLAVPTK